MTDTSNTDLRSSQRLPLLLFPVVFRPRFRAAKPETLCCRIELRGFITTARLFRRGCLQHGGVEGNSAGAGADDDGGGGAGGSPG
jgi:hypothetical protein